MNRVFIYVCLYVHLPSYFSGFYFTIFHCLITKKRHRMRLLPYSKNVYHPEKITVSSILKRCCRLHQKDILWRSQGLRKICSASGVLITTRYYGYKDILFIQKFLKHNFVSKESIQSSTYSCIENLRACFLALR